jgi:hypothetical protein
MKKKISALVRTRIVTALQPFGFIASADGLFYVRVVDGVVQSIFLSKTRYKDRYNVVCSLLESDHRFAGDELPAVDESRELISGASAQFALSPVAPFQNTYDWSFAEESDALDSLGEIVPLIEAMALPVLAKIGSSARLRLVQEPSFAEQAARQVAGLLADEMSGSGFARSDEGEFLWKRNGEVFAIVLPTVVGFGSFLKINVLLWSPLRHGTVATPEMPPSNFSRVAFACLSREGLTSAGVASLWPVDIDAQKVAGLDDILECLAGSAFMAWLQEHQTVASLLEVVSEDLRPYVQREIEAAA